ncbi:A24 family peptidase [Aureimonas sp. AU40]|uniref:A24 family peptidase n=1 Tax=Aureimonas sp. AU40 TaxID=1637747 RepID=UPI000782ECCB|nr:prepilin peptidase [Aureimonas sp. AU40]
MVSVVCGFFFLLLMLRAVVTDLAHMTISNRLVGAILVCFLIFVFANGWSPAAIGLHLAVSMTALLLTFAAFALGWMGGGDAKLISATALWFGPTVALWDYLFLASLFGGILTLLLILARACWKPQTGNASLDRLLSPTSGVPYGVALGMAGIIVASRSPDMQGVFALI